MSSIIRNLKFVIAEERRDVYMNARSLEINIEASSDCSGILSISYTYINGVGEVNERALNYSLIDIMCASIIYNKESLWSSEDAATLRFRLEYIICNFDSDDLASLTYISRRVLNKYDVCYDLSIVVESFLIGISLYMCIIDMSTSDGTEIYDLLGIDVDFAVPEIKEGIFSSSYFKYIGMILQAAQVTGGQFTKELALIVISFINGWSSNFSSDVTIDIHELIFNLTSEVFSRAMVKFSNIESAIEERTRDSMSEIKNRLSILENMLEKKT